MEVVVVLYNPSRTIWNRKLDAQSEFKDGILQLKL